VTFGIRFAIAKAQGRLSEQRPFVIAEEDFIEANILQDGNL